MVVVVINIDVDYMVIYGGDFNKLKKIFVEFFYNLLFYGLVVMCVDDLVVCEIFLQIVCLIVIYGFSEDVDVCVINICQEGMCIWFIVLCLECELLDVLVNMFGLYNVLNFLVIIVIVIDEGIFDEVIVQGLFGFQGVGWCFQVYGELQVEGGSVMLVDDYGYYLCEVVVVIKVICGGWLECCLVMVYQLYCYICICDLYEDFVQVLGEVNVLLLMEVYLVGEELILGVDSCQLCYSICQCGQFDLIYFECDVDLVLLVKLLLCVGDILFCQGVGDVGGLVL